MGHNCFCSGLFAARLLQFGSNAPAAIVHLPQSIDRSEPHTTTHGRPSTPCITQHHVLRLHDSYLYALRFIPLQTPSGKLAPTHVDVVRQRIQLSLLVAQSSPRPPIGPQPDMRAYHHHLRPANKALRLGLLLSLVAAVGTVGAIPSSKPRPGASAAASPPPAAAVVSGSPQPAAAAAGAKAGAHHHHHHGLPRIPVMGFLNAAFQHHGAFPIHPLSTHPSIHPFIHPMHRAQSLNNNKTPSTYSHTHKPQAPAHRRPPFPQHQLPPAARKRPCDHRRPSRQRERRQRREAPGTTGGSITHTRGASPSSPLLPPPPVGPRRGRDRMPQHRWGPPRRARGSLSSAAAAPRRRARPTAASTTASPLST